MEAYQLTRRFSESKSTAGLHTASAEYNPLGSIQIVVAASIQPFRRALTERHWMVSFVCVFETNKRTGKQSGRDDSVDSPFTLFTKQCVWSVEGFRKIPEFF